ncbi:MAG: thioredoxin [Eubacteriales bacterium]|nr:thioredoxin [Eubacteriales bacterium]
MAEILLNEENFDKEVLHSELPVLVDFFATWCGPCRMLAPIIEELAEEQEGKVKVCKLNVDDASGIAARYGISSIPTLILFRNGEIAASSLGFKPKAEIEELLK